MATPPTIDGNLDEEVWKLAPPATDFIQKDPDEGKPASERSEVRVLYDDEAIYFGCRYYDSDPSKIVARLSRRDDAIESDFAEIDIDSYHDHQTGFSFAFNVSGVKIDAQALAVSLAIYVTNSNLAGTVAVQYGFYVTSAGTGAATYNIGSAGQAFNVANNSILTILSIMQSTNSQAKKGVLWDLNGNGSISSAEQTLRNLANAVFTDINETGDIS